MLPRAGCAHMVALALIGIPLFPPDNAVEGELFHFRTRLLAAPTGMLEPATPPPRRERRRANCRGSSSCSPRLKVHRLRSDRPDNSPAATIKNPRPQTARPCVFPAEGYQPAAGAQNAPEEYALHTSSGSLAMLGSDAPGLIASEQN